MKIQCSLLVRAHFAALGKCTFLVLVFLILGVVSANLKGLSPGAMLPKIALWGVLAGFVFYLFSVPFTLRARRLEALFGLQPLERWNPGYAYAARVCPGVVDAVVRSQLLLAQVAEERQISAATRESVAFHWRCPSCKWMKRVSIRLDDAANLRIDVRDSMRWTTILMGEPWEAPSVLAGIVVFLHRQGILDIEPRVLEPQALLKRAVGAWPFESLEEKSGRGSSRIDAGVIRAIRAQRLAHFRWCGAKATLVFVLVSSALLWLVSINPSLSPKICALPAPLFMFYVMRAYHALTRPIDVSEADSLKVGGK